MFSPLSPLEQLTLFLVFLGSGLFFEYFFSQVYPVFKDPKLPRILRVHGPALIGASVALILVRMIIGPPI